MSFDWADYLKLAEQLLAADGLHDELAESRHRCVASRAYYAALCRAATYISNVIGDTLPDDHRFHECVISRFREADERRWQSVGSRLGQLHDYRAAADYDASAGNWPKRAEASVELSRRAIQELEQIFSGPPPAA